MHSLILLLAAASVWAQGHVAGSARVDKEYWASINDTISLYTTLSFSGPVGSVSVRLLDTGCTVEPRDDYYRLAVRDTGVYRAVFTSRTAGAAAAETLHVRVTDMAPVIVLESHALETVVGEPFRAGLNVTDDGEGVKVYVDFDSDNKADTVCDALPEPSFVFRKPTPAGERDGRFNMRVKIVDNDRHAAYDSIALSVQYKPPKAEAGSNTIVCLGEPCALSGGRSKDLNGKVKGWLWDFNCDGKPEADVPRPETDWAFDRAGDYRVALTVRDNDGNLSLPDTLFVSVMEDKPVAVAQTPVRGKAGRKVDLVGRGTSPCSEIDKYLWDFQNDGRFDFTSRSQGKAQAVYPVAGDYTARFAVVNARGDSASQLCIVKIEP